MSHISMPSDTGKIHLKVKNSPPCRCQVRDSPKQRQRGQGPGGLQSNDTDPH